MKSILSKERAKEVVELLNADCQQVQIVNRVLKAHFTDVLSSLPEFQEKKSDLLGDLLARIHRDGGHRTAAIGIEASCEEAHGRVAAMIAMNDQEKKSAWVKRTFGVPANGEYVNLLARDGVQSRVCTNMPEDYDADVWTHYCPVPPPPEPEDSELVKDMKALREKSKRRLDTMESLMNEAVKIAQSYQQKKD